MTEQPTSTPLEKETGSKAPSSFWRRLKLFLIVVFLVCIVAVAGGLWWGLERADSSDPEWAGRSVVERLGYALWGSLIDDRIEVAGTQWQDEIKRLEDSDHQALMTEHLNQLEQDLKAVQAALQEQNIHSAQVEPASSAVISLQNQIHELASEVRQSPGEALVDTVFVSQVARLHGAQLELSWAHHSLQSADYGPAVAALASARALIIETGLQSAEPLVMLLDDFMARIHEAPSRGWVDDQVMAVQLLTEIDQWPLRQSPSPDETESSGDEGSSSWWSRLFDSARSTVVIRPRGEAQGTRTPDLDMDSDWTRHRVMMLEQALATRNQVLIRAHATALAERIRAQFDPSDAQVSSALIFLEDLNSEPVELSLEPLRQLQADLDQLIQTL